MPSAFRSFEYDRANDHAVMLVRGIGAVWTIGCVIWLGFVLRNWVGLLMGLLGTLCAFVWAAMVAKARKRSRSVVALRLTPDALELDDGPRSRVVHWPDVRAVDVDEDLLNVRVAVRDGEALCLEPMFRGVGVYELADAVRAAWRATLPTRSAG